MVRVAQKWLKTLGGNSEGWQKCIVQSKGGLSAALFHLRDNKVKGRPAAFQADARGVRLSYPAPSCGPATRRHRYGPDASLRPSRPAQFAAAWMDTQADNARRRLAPIAGFESGPRSSASQR